MERKKVRRCPTSSSTTIINFIPAPYEGIRCITYWYTHKIPGNSRGFLSFAGRKTKRFIRFPKPETHVFFVVLILNKSPYAFIIFHVWIYNNPVGLLQRLSLRAGIPCVPNSYTQQQLVATEPVASPDPIICDSYPDYYLTVRNNFYENNEPGP